jgi:di/tricarboxylate transporter
MTLDMWIVVAVIAATFVAIASGRLRSELASLAACCALVVTGVLETWDVFPAFGSDAVVTVGAMFVLSAALERTGLIDAASRTLQGLPIRSEFAMLCLLLPPVVAMSAFANNTPVVVVFMPIIVTVARQNGLAISKLLIPLSFASILGGASTLIGSSTNLVASSAGERLGQLPIAMFELTPVGLVLAGAGLVYLLIFAPRVLRRRETVTTALEGGASRQFLTEAFVPAGSSLVGRTARDALARALKKGRILELVRHGRVYGENPGSLILEPGDRLRVHVDAASVNAIKERRGLQMGTEDLALGDTEETQIVECVVSPRSDLVGRTLAAADLPRRGVTVLALHRASANLREHLNDIPLLPGDVMLIEASEHELAKLRHGGDLLVLAGGQKRRRRSKRWIAMFLVAAVVALSAWQIVPVSVAALGAAVLAVASRCIDAEEAYHAIDWPTLFLIAGMLALGIALEKTHVSEVMARVLLTEIASFGPAITLSIVILVASVLTNLLSNNAVAALLVPIAIEAARLVDASPRAFLVGVAFGASACFATPIGYQTNTLVFSAGGYRFSDFVRLGLPLNIIYWLVASIMIPLVWPLAAP